jgi:nitrogen fixation-related uncharacterized protein
VSNGEEIMIRVSFLLIAVPLILLIVWAVKKALQNSDLYGNLDEAEELKVRVKIARQLNPEEIKQQRAEIARIQKEIE